MPKSKKKSPARAYISLHEEPFFVEVVLYETKGQLKRATQCQTCAGMFRPESYTITCRTNRSGTIRTMRVPFNLGTIHLARPMLGSGYIAHECLHAALHWAHVTQRDPTQNMEVEEEFCWQHGELVRNVVIWLKEKQGWA